MVSLSSTPVITLSDNDPDSGVLKSPPDSLSSSLLSSSVNILLDTLTESVYGDIRMFTSIINDNKFNVIGII